MSFDMSEFEETFDLNSRIDLINSLQKNEKTRRDEFKTELNIIHLESILVCLWRWQVHHDWSSLSKYLTKVGSGKGKSIDPAFRRAIKSCLPDNVKTRVVNKTLRFLSTDGKRIEFSDDDEAARNREWLQIHLKSCSSGLRSNPIDKDFKERFPDTTKVDPEKVTTRLEKSMERALDKLFEQGELPDQQTMLDMVRKLYSAYGQQVVAIQDIREVA